MSGVVAEVAKPARVAHSERWSGLLQASEGAGVGRDLPTRSLIFDCLVAAVFIGCGSVFLPIFMPQAALVDFTFVWLVNLPLILRRRLPRVSFVMILAAATVQSWWPAPIGLHDGGVLFSLYSLVGFTNRRTGLAGAFAMLIPAMSGAVNDWWNFVDQQLVRDPGLITRIFTTLGMLGLVFAAWASGERLRSARVGQVALLDRAAQLEREREQQARLAASAERARIAREMHDVIAHGLSVMIAQADGGAYVIDQNKDEAKAALERISATGRDSLTQMRGLLGLLRAGEGDNDQPTGPQPGIDQLPQLIEDGTRSGLQISFHRQGTDGQVAQMIGLTVYRLVQESLTNARKHGGDQVEVLVDRRPDGVDLQVINDLPTDAKRLQTGDVPGHGLNGMGERVAAVGGRLVTEHTKDGFIVHAWLPDTPDTVSGD